MAEEAEIERSAAAYAKKLGMMTYKLEGRRQAGWPDRIFVWNGHTWYIEFKAPGCKPSPIQTYVLNELRERHVRAYVVDNLAKAKEILDELHRLCPPVGDYGRA